MPKSIEGYQDYDSTTAVRAKRGPTSFDGLEEINYDGSNDWVPADLANTDYLETDISLNAKILLKGTVSSDARVDFEIWGQIGDDFLPWASGSVILLQSTGAGLSDTFDLPAGKWKLRIRSTDSITGLTAYLFGYAI